MTFTNKKSLIALLIALCMVVSLFTLSASAEESTVATTEETTVAATEETTEAGSEKGTEETTSKGEETTSKKEETTAKKEETTSKKEETTTNNSAAEKLEQQLAEARAQKTKVLIINAIIIAVIIIICVVVGIKFRAKLAAFFRSVKSELGKIVWSSKENTRKSFLVVIVIAVAVAILIGILDLAFSSGVSMLDKLIG